MSSDRPLAQAWPAPSGPWSVIAYTVRAGRPAHLLRADLGDQPLDGHQPQIAVQRADADAAPLADVRHLGDQPDLMTVLRPVALASVPSTISRVRFTRLVS